MTEIFYNNMFRVNVHVTLACMWHVPQKKYIANNLYTVLVNNTKINYKK